MSRFAVFYIILAIFRKIGRFFLHWYINGSRAFWHATLDFIGELEGVIALRVTVYNWTSPLYGDYTAFGFVFGIPVRTVRIFLSGAFYLALFALSGLLYLVWLAIPVFLLSRIAG